MQLTNQKRLAAKILGCGENRVWINPDYIDEIASSVQADDIREFIEEGLIRAKAVKGTSRVRARARHTTRKLRRRRRGRGCARGRSDRRRAAAAADARTSGGASG